MGKVLAVCISEKKGTVKHPVPEIDLRVGHGIEGDAHAGDWHRQVSLLAAESIDYTVHDDYRQHYDKKANAPMVLVESKFFTTTLYDLTEPMDLDYSDLDSFVILIGVGGEGVVTDSEGNQTTLNAGETILVPATEKGLRVEGTVKFLESYV